MINLKQEGWVRGGLIDRLFNTHFIISLSLEHNLKANQFCQIRFTHNSFIDKDESISQYNFVETLRKFITTRLSIRKLDNHHMILLVYKVTQHRNTLHWLGNLIYLVHVMRTKKFKLQKETIATVPPGTKGTEAISILKQEGRLVNPEPLRLLLNSWCKEYCCRICVTIRQGCNVLVPCISYLFFFAVDFKE